MIDRCPFCAHIVGEEDEKCPACERDLTFSPPPPERKKRTSKPQAPSFVGYPAYMREERRSFVPRDESPFGRFISRRRELVFSLTGVFILFFIFWQYYGDGGIASAPARPPISKVSAAIEAPRTIHAWPHQKANAAHRDAPHRAGTPRERHPGQLSPQPPHLKAVSGPRAAPEKSKSASMPSQGSWIFHGEVYDLSTFEPVKLVHVIFKDIKENKSYETYSGLDGRFRIDIPAAPGRGYYLELEDGRYEPRRHLVMDSQKVKQLSVAQRKALANDLYKALDPPAGVFPPPQGRMLDIWLIPKRQ